MLTGDTTLFVLVLVAISSNSERSRFLRSGGGKLAWSSPQQQRVPPCEEDHNSLTLEESKTSLIGSMVSVVITRMVEDCEVMVRCCSHLPVLSSRHVLPCTPFHTSRYRRHPHIVKSPHSP